MPRQRHALQHGHARDAVMTMRSGRGVPCSPPGGKTRGCMKHRAMSTPALRPHLRRRACSHRLSGLGVRGGSLEQTRRVGKRARPHDRNDEVNHAEHERHAACDQVDGAKHDAMAAQPAGGGEHEALLAIEGVRIVLVKERDVDDVARLERRAVDDAPELAEVVGVAEPHPYHESLVLLNSAGYVVSAALVVDRWVEELREVVCEAAADVAGKGDAVFGHSYALRQRVDAARQLNQVICVVEERPRNKAARVDQLAVVLLVVNPRHAALRQRLRGDVRPPVAFVRQLQVKVAPNVSSEVLVHALDLVVHVDRRLHFYVNRQANVARQRCVVASVRPKVVLACHVVGLVLEADVIVAVGH
mmetsp:Transcript_5339/g.16168  ORF Transcript_5339/g.16168 Transcript_5339/m.16168 type:complete len:359 (-) Transcript_5339:721-1797(-)